MLADIDGDKRDDLVVAEMGNDEVDICFINTPFQVTSYGSGCPGAKGIPSISVSGRPEIGNRDFRLHLGNGRAKKISILLASFELKGMIETGSCDISKFGDFYPFISLTDLLGNCTVPLPIPRETNLIGLSAFFQWFVVDEKGLIGPGIYSSTRGLRIVLGE